MILSPGDLAWLSLLKEYELSDDEAKALIFVRETGAIDNATYRDLCRVDMLGCEWKIETFARHWAFGDQRKRTENVLYSQ